MSEVILYIESSQSGNLEPVDLFENESLPYTFQFSDVAELKALGSFTKSFRIPASTRNDSIFLGWFNANATAPAFDHTKKVPARIVVDTIPYSIGHVQLNKVYLRGEVIHEYEVTFFAESPDLTRSIGDKKLKDITDLPTLDHQVNYTNVTTGTADYQYALCDRGQKFSENGELETRPIFNPAIPLYAADLTPHVNAKWLFDNIISDAGFTWSGWNGSTALADSLTDIWVPWLNSRYIKYTEAPEADFFGLNNDANETGINTPSFGVDHYLFSDILPSYTEAYDNGGNVASGIFTAPFTGYYTFKIYLSIKITTFNSQGGAFIQLWLYNPNDQFNPWAVSPGAFYNNPGPTNGVNLSHTFTVFLNQGDEVEAGFKCPGDRTFTVYGDTFDPQTIEQVGTGFRLIDVSQSLAGQDISMPLNAPDVKQIDFLRDVMKMHNLAIIPDRQVPGRLFIEPMPTYLYTGQTRDWTSRVDTDKDIVLSPTTEMQSKVLKFTYKEGADAASQIYVKQAGRVYGDYLIEGYQPAGGAASNDFATGDMTVEMVASSTPCLEINGTNVVTAKFLNDGGEFVNPGLRFVYLSGNAVGVAIVDDDLPNPSPSPVTVFANLQTVNHYSATFPTIGDLDLNWAPEVPLYSIPANPYNNLFNRFYRTYLNDIYDARARKLECHMKLTLTDLLRFSFADRIWLKDSYWRVLEISDYLIGSEQPCKVTLLKVVNPDDDCEFTPDDVTPGGVVEFVDADNVTSFGNQNCCERYGYTWDSDAERCFAFRTRKPPVDAYESALTGWGLSGGNAGGPNNNPSGSGSIGVGLNVATDMQHGFVAGQDIEIGTGNPTSIAVGNRILIGNDTRGAFVSGRNAEVNMPGLHYGGGWEADDLNTTRGRAQYGTIILSGQGNYSASTDEIDVTIEGRSGLHVELNDNGTWMCNMSVAMHRYNTGTGDTDAFHYAVFTFLIAYKGGAGSTSAINRAVSVGDFGTLDLIVDDTTDPTQHRFALRSTGASSYPYNNVKITCALTYTQVRS